MIKGGIRVKRISFIIIFLLIFTSTSFVYAVGDTNIKIVIDNTPVQFDIGTGSPFIDGNSRTQVPFRIALEAYGAQVVWDDETNTAIAIKGDTIVQIPIGKSYIVKNESIIYTDTSALIKDGHTYLPIRPVIEAFSGTVNWEPSDATIEIFKPNATSITQNNYSYGSISTSDFNYTGYLNNNQPDIKGYFKYSDGSTYQGELSDGKYSGTGVLKFADADEYSGYFNNGIKDGHGIYKASEIAYIEGTWVNGELEGKANIFYLDRSTYDGNMKDSLRNGNGTFTFANGDHYVGEWANDVYNGHGIYYFSNGSFYDGTWKDGRLDGTVIYQKSSYLKYNCVFDDGEVIECEVTY
jgi:hypothetical protein